MPCLNEIEDACERRRMTLCVHPALRQAIRGHEASFQAGLHFFLDGKSDGLFFLPLAAGGHVRLVFSKKVSKGGYRIIRVDPLTTEGMARIKQAMDPSVPTR